MGVPSNPILVIHSQEAEHSEEDDDQDQMLPVVPSGPILQRPNKFIFHQHKDCFKRCQSVGSCEPDSQLDKLKKPKRPLPDLPLLKTQLSNPHAAA